MERRSDASTGPSAVDRRRSLLLRVLLCDASACSVLAVVAVLTRSRPCGPGLAAIARVAIASFLPGAAAVVRERRAHHAAPPMRHGMTGAVLLFVCGLLVNTAGTVRILLEHRGSGRAVLVTDVALMIAGNAIGVPYLTLVRALHTART